MSALRGRKRRIGLDASAMATGVPRRRGSSKGTFNAVLGGFPQELVMSVELSGARRSAGLALQK
jgi:hypothetical protein